jgi:hypothetical protein
LSNIAIVGALNLEKTISVGRKRQFKLQLQAAADLIGLGHYSWNPQTNELTWDPVLTGIWALPPGIKPDFKIWLDGIHPHDVPRVLAEIVRCTDPRGDGIYDITYRVIGPDGVVRSVRVRGQTHFENGQPIDHAGVLIPMKKHLYLAGDLYRTTADWLIKGQGSPPNTDEPPPALMRAANARSMELCRACHDIESLHGRDGVAFFIEVQRQALTGEVKPRFPKYETSPTLSRLANVRAMEFRKACQDIESLYGCDGVAFFIKMEIYALDRVARARSL